MGRSLVPLLVIGGGDQVILGADVRQILLIGGFQGRQLRSDLLGVHIPQILGSIGNIHAVTSTVAAAIAAAISAAVASEIDAAVHADILGCVIPRVLLAGLQSCVYRVRVVVAVLQRHISGQQRPVILVHLLREHEL